MTSLYIRTFILTMYTTIAAVESSGCASTIALQAEHYQQTLVSLDTTRNMTGPFRCSWLIKASNTSHLIEIQMLNVYLSPISSCQMDNVILSTGLTDETIRVWCKDYLSRGIITTSSSRVYIHLTTTSDDVTGLIFILKFWSTMSQTVSGPVRLGPANYFLISFSILIGTALLVGVIYLFYREYTTLMQRKEQTFKKKLRVRRQGISGASGIVNTHFEMEDTSSEKETTLSYLTVSPSPECSV